MYRTGDYMVYGSYGLCEIREIGPSPLDPADTRSYYRLHPVHASASSLIFSPVDNESVVKRPPMSPDEARALLAALPSIAPLEVPSEKHRRDIYRETLRTTDPYGAAALLRTVMLRREIVRRAGRRLTDADADNEKKAMDNLSGELSFVLGLSLAEAQEKIEQGLSGAAT